uniref:Uncharacterized protein n=1 Tax=Arthrobacter sp. JBH1 TaxID=723551 RepID=I1Y9I0_9MICC|nr:hypothetical protein [Arthrobacter sp. JBH1]
MFEPDDCVDVRVGLTAQDLEQSWMREPGVLRNASQRPSVDRFLEFDGECGSTSFNASESVTSPLSTIRLIALPFQSRQA